MSQYIRSADRWKLNVQILDALAERSNVKMFFHHGLRRMSLDQNTVDFENMSVYLSGNLFLSLVVYEGLLSFGGVLIAQGYEGDCSREH